MSRTCLLIGPPGSGKTTMIGLTAPAPVHIVDIDRKVNAMASLHERVKEGALTFWPLEETLAEERIQDRIKMLAKREEKQISRPPMGWQRFAELVDRLPKDPVSLAANTWAIDSATQLAPHLVNTILFYSQATAGMSPREWGYFLRMWAETITILRDAALSAGKNLIITVHERVSEVPTSGTRISHEKNREGDVQRVFTGPMTMKVAPSIDGQFGLQMASYFEEVYALRVDVVDGKPKWVCRVKPDGLRDLRTSFAVEQEEFEPDFRKVWR